MHIRVVFFDWGGTLARTWVSEGHHPAEYWELVLRERELRVRQASIRRALDDTDSELDGRIYEYLGRTQEFWRLHDFRVMDRLGIHEGRDALAETVDRRIQEASWGELYPEVMPTLTALRIRGFVLGVISNHNDALRDILAHHGLSNFFNTVTYSQEVGAEKPDRRVFDLALQRAHCQPGEALHVGDSYRADYIGATGVGMRAIWLNRLQVPPPEPCANVGDLRAILPLVSK